ncbi:MAG: hypothetical protein ACLQNE_16090 [Thermoguttaceae bacterium]
MNDDPIVASVRKVREELAAAFDYDVHAIFADLRRREADLGHQLVRQSQTQRPSQTMHPSGGSGRSPEEDAHSPAPG